MPPTYNRIPAVTQVPEDMNALVLFLNRAIAQINEVLAEISTADSQFRGNDGYIPEYHNDVDLQRNRLRNIGRSQQGGDAVTRRELEEIGILGNVRGVTFNDPVTFNSNLFSTGPQSGGGSELATNANVSEMISSATEGLVPVTISGQTIRDQTSFSAGTTEGILAMGRDGNSRAEFVQVRNGRLQMADEDACAILWLIYHELRSLRDAGNSD